jgi:hypothetical protein
MVWYEIIHDLDGDNENLAEYISKILASADTGLMVAPDNAIIPIDKINTNIWKMLDEETHGQLKMGFDVSNAQSADKVNIMFSLEFEKGVSITRKLTPYDKRVYVAIGALYECGNKTMTYGQIYKAMGYNGKPGKTDIKKIHDSITKMSCAHIFINNQEEQDAGYNYPVIKYDGNLLAMQRATKNVNGVITDNAVQIGFYPPLLEFAKQRKQITTISTQLLDTPLSKTNMHIQLEDYFIEEISKIKNGKRNAKMLYTTIYENVGATTKKQKQRLRPSITTLLTFYKEHEFIKDFKESTDKKGIADGIIIEY